jgi:low temperature requirement protein LtrA
MLDQGKHDNIEREGETGSVYRHLLTDVPGKDVLGYFCFWTLTWWVWASQVAFNVRFRQGDTVNRIAAVLQLAVFGSLSAFTTDFDITDGLGKPQTRFEAAALSIQTQLNYSTVLDVHQHIFQTDDRISILNFRGISMTMALSRLLLMLQHSIGIVPRPTSCCILI